MKVLGYGAPSVSDTLVPLSFERQDLRDGEVSFKVTYCGVCHSDVHQVHDDWDNSLYPCVPGHEIVGEVTAVGSGVTKFKPGDLIGVGCMVNSCQKCDYCKEGYENYCQGPKSCTLTYNGPKKPDGSNSYGGYSTHMIVREEFGITVPDSIDPKYVGPIMCAATTVYAPMLHWKLEKGQTLGVLGVGGLGHMAVQLGKALGARVVAFTSHADKQQAIRDLGADQAIVHTDEEQMKSVEKSIDLLIDTVPYPHELDKLLSVMKTDTTIVVVGNFIEFPKFVPGPMVFERIQIAGSLIGGVKETQEVLNLCAERDIKPEIKVIGIEDINDVFELLRRNSDHEFRHVIDMASLHEQAEQLTSEAKQVEAPVRGEVVGR